MCFFLWLRPPPRSTRTDTLLPYTTLFRSLGRVRDDGGEDLFDGPRPAVLAVTQAGHDVEQALEVGGRVAHCCFRNGRQVDGATLVSGRSAFRIVVPRAMAESQANVIQCRRLSGEGTSRSEEHTSELQSLMSISYAVFCLKKKKTNLTIT